MRCVRRAAAGFAIVAVLGLPTASSQRDQLRNAAHGTWTSEFGTLTFGDDGTASFAIKNCGYTPGKPGFVTALTDCAPQTTSGKVKIAAHGILLEETTQVTTNYDAYVDARGRLHLGSGAVGTISSDRKKASVAMTPTSRLKVRGSTCTVSGSFIEKPIRSTCRFTTTKGRTVMTFRSPDDFDQEKITTAALVVLPHEHLLVAPFLVAVSFEKQ